MMTDRQIILEWFATQLNDPARIIKWIATVAATCPRWGDRKVFISDVADAIRRDDKSHGTDEDYRDGLKSILPELNRRGLITLSRLDLTQLANERKVLASQTETRLALWHLIVLE